MVVVGAGVSREVMGAAVVRLVRRREADRAMVENV